MYPQRQGTGNQATLKKMEKKIEEMLKAAYSKCVSIHTTIKWRFQFPVIYMITKQSYSLQLETFRVIQTI